MQKKTMTIKTEQLTKSFGDRTVLKKIDISISEGEIFGLLGPSGAGKTTLIKILTGQLTPTGGQAKMLGCDVTKLSQNEYGKIGMVLDNTGLYERLSCYDNLALFAEIYGISKKGIEESLAKVGLKEAIKRPVGKISKGMRQRLVLARALMHSPQILFLDEPTSGLDPATAREIHELMLEQQKRGTTIFLTTHNMEEAAKLCDPVALLNEGKIVEYGAPGEVCRKYNHQNRIRILLKEGEQLELPNNQEAAERIHSLFQNNAVESIHSTEPTLETVFMELTGRKLA